MMNHSMEILCVVWWEKLAATHPDDLFPSEQQALERHVASCQACAAVRAEYQTIDALLLAGAPRHAGTRRRGLDLVGRSVSRIFTGCISSSSQERGRVPPGQPRELRGEGLCTFLECSS